MDAGDLAVRGGAILGSVAGGYLVGSIPFAYIIVRLVTGEDITEHGTGNVGAMNVRRSTGSWSWFALAMIADALKGLVPVAFVRLLTALPALVPASAPLSGYVPPGQDRLETYAVSSFMLMGVLAGAVLGHNYSAWMALAKRRFARTGKGLATGGGALLAYDWRYFAAVLLVGLAVIAITRYMMAGQVAAAIALPVAALVLRSPDRLFAFAMAGVVYAAHHTRFIGLLRGREPKLYIHDRMGPRG